MADERFVFVTEWYDPNATLMRKYQLLFYPSDNTIEMFDMKNRRVFLKRCKAENIRLEDLYVGSTVNILSRQLKFTEYGDEFTRRSLCEKKERTLGIIKPDAVGKMGQVLDLICQNGFLITQLKMCRLSKNEAFEFYKEHQHRDFFNQLVDFMTSGPVVAFELMGVGAIQKWRQLLGPTDSAQARSQEPLSIRARFGTDNTRNACHGSDSLESAARECEFFFSTTGPHCPNTATFSQCTCAVIKPHAVVDGQAGKIISKILEVGFEISAVQMFHLEKANAEEFYEIYKGVVQEYPKMVDELTAGPCIALEIRAENAPQAFREMVGPADPEIARHLRDRTLRALFGRNKIQNAVHCTDLPEDGLLEVEYFFKILDR